MVTNQRSALKDLLNLIENKLDTIKFKVRTSSLDIHAMGGEQ